MLKMRILYNQRTNT